MDSSKKQNKQKNVDKTKKHTRSVHTKVATNVKQKKNNKPGNKKRNRAKDNAEGKKMISIARPGATIAQGGSSVVPITVQICPMSIQTYDLALVSYAYQKATTEFDMVYGFHSIMNADMRQLASNGVDVVSSRPRYLNTLMQLWKAKTVQYLGMTYRYNFTNIDIAPAVSPLVSVRNKKFAMYIAGVDNSNLLCIQNPPSNYTLTTGLAAYTNVLSIVTNQSQNKNLQAQSVAEASSVFEKDPSIYASRSPYAGTEGGCPSGGFASSENECYGGALPILSVGPELSQNTDRAAHELAFSSGDATSAFGYGLLPWFRMLHYSTRYAPIIKYIEYGELWTVWSSWFAECIAKSLDGPGSQAAAAYLANPIPFLYAKIAFRQTLMTYFNVSQACVQFQTYQAENTIRFEGFLVGSNSVGRLTNTLFCPAVLQENIRMLECKLYQVAGVDKAEKFSQLFVPCIGTILGSEYNNPYVQYGEDSVPVFGPLPPNEADVGLVDGVVNNIVYDFNSVVIQNAVAVANETISNLSVVCGPFGLIAGSCNATLLTYTRYLQYGNSDFKSDVVVPVWAQTSTYKNLIAEAERKKKAKESEKKLSRTNSKKTVETREVGDGLEAYYTRGFSAYNKIYNEDMTLFNSFVIPSVVSYINNQTVATNQPCMQTIFSEPNSLTVSKNVGNSNLGSQSMMEMLTTLGKSLAPGVAANANSEAARVVSDVQKNNEGGFFQGLLAGLDAFLVHV